MKTCVRHSLIFVFGLVLSACTSLNDTQYQKETSLTGTYSCEYHADKKAEHESLPRADVSRIRCYQDLWDIKGDEADFTRTYYQTPQCETIIGRVSYHYGNKEDRSSCKLVRSNADWLAENKGECPLKDLPLNKEVSIDALKNCRKYLPTFCSDDKKTFSFQPEKRKEANHPPNQLTVSGSENYISTCKRYLE